MGPSLRRADSPRRLSSCARASRSIRSWSETIFPPGHSKTLHYLYDHLPLRYRNEPCTKPFIRLLGGISPETRLSGVRSLFRRSPARLFVVLTHHRLGVLPLGNPLVNTAQPLAA